MPAIITALCCLQALVLEQRSDKGVFLAAQAAAPLFDPSVRRTQLPLRAIAAHALLFAGSLLFAAWASRIDRYHGSAAMNALIKSLSPLLSAWLSGQRSSRHWLAAIGSFAGIAVATDFYIDGTRQGTLAPLAAYGCLLVGTVLGVLHGFVQQAYGDCPLEMAVGAALICASTALWDAPPALSAELVLGVPLYGALSLYVSRSVREYAKSINYDPFAFSLMLNERRAVTIALGCLQSQTPMRLLAGAALALAAIQLVPKKERLTKRVEKIAE